MDFINFFKLLTRQYFKYLKLIIIVVSFLPFLDLVWKYQNDQLGTNPLAYMTVQSGHLALIFLLITLSITPIKRLSSDLMTKYHLRYGKRLADWNWIIRLRKTFGLFSFFYACVHLAIYLWFDQGLEWEYIIEDILERPFIMVGITSYIILFVLAVTSLKILIKKLKKNWRRLHMSIYPLVLLCLLHYLLLSKTVTNDFWIYASLTSLLLGYRVLVWANIIHIRKDDDGMEVSHRPKP